MSRKTMFLILAAATLLAGRARAVTPPQAGTGPAIVRERCSTCARDERRVREKLLLQIDSLRWHIENRRMTEDERRRTIGELSVAIRALQQSLDESARGAVVAAAAEAAAGELAMAPPVAIARVPVRARGYLGVTFDGPSAEIARPGDYAVRFYKYPRIALVEPSSPAERAGVLQGDTLLSFNGTDVVSNEISLTKLLVPESKIVMRVRREGNHKDLKVIVGEAPDYYVRRREAPSAMARVGAVGVSGVEHPARVSAAPQPPLPPEPAQPSVILWQEYDGVAGARVETVSEGLGKALGVEEGVLVVRVRPGTPAYRAGLRDGDVIVRAGTQRIRTVPMLRSALSMGDGDEGVRLLIKRERRDRDITLRW